MRTSLNEIEMIDAYLLGRLSHEENRLVEAKMILNKDLEIKAALQQEVYDQARLYGRKMLTKEIERVHRKLFSSREYSWFSRNIRNLFRQN